jgi:hypothetical protein
MSFGEQQSKFRLSDYLIMAVCVFLMVLLLAMNNPSFTFDFQKIFDTGIRWSEMVLASGIDHLRGRLS